MMRPQAFLALFLATPALASPLEIQSECTPKQEVQLQLSTRRLYSQQIAFVKSARWLLEQNERPATLANQVYKVGFAGIFDLKVPLDTPTETLKDSLASLEPWVHETMPDQEEMRVTRIVQAVVPDRTDLFSRIVDEVTGRGYQKLNGEKVTEIPAGLHVELERKNRETGAWEPYRYPVTAGAAFAGSTPLVRVFEHMHGSEISKVLREVERCQWRANGFDMAGNLVDDHRFASREVNPKSIVTERKNEPKLKLDGTVKDFAKRPHEPAADVGATVDAR